MSLAGKKVVIVGAGTGIGRAVALAAAEQGATVVLAGRTRATLEETAVRVGGDPPVQVLDASVEEDVASFFAALGPFDHLVSTASQGVAGALTSLAAADIARALGAKLWAAIHLVKHGAPRIAPDGSFVFFSGIRGARPAPGTGIASLANGGIEAFARAMAVELGPVRVNVISPGVVDSGPFWERLGEAGRQRLFDDFAARSPARRVGRPEDVAAATLFALTNPFLTGAVLPVDGGALLI